MEPLQGVSFSEDFKSGTRKSAAVIDFRDEPALGESLSDARLTKFINFGSTNQPESPTMRTVGPSDEMAYLDDFQAQNVKLEYPPLADNMPSPIYTKPSSSFISSPMHNHSLVVRMGECDLKPSKTKRWLTNR